MYFRVWFLASHKGGMNEPLGGGRSTEEVWEEGEVEKGQEVGRCQIGKVTRMNT